MKVSSKTVDTTAMAEKLSQMDDITRAFGKMEKPMGLAETSSNPVPTMKVNSKMISTKDKVNYINSTITPTLGSSNKTKCMAMAPTKIKMDRSSRVSTNMASEMDLVL